MTSIKNSIDANENLELSVVLACPDQFATIRKTVGFLSAQTIADKIELVLVSSRQRPLQFDAAEVAAFGGVRLVELDDSWLIARARALGVRSSSTRYVAFAEDHCFPEPDWAQAMLQALQEGHVAVGPLFLNANPATALSWANLILGFGPWLGALPDGPVNALPWHNTAYRRDVLLAPGSHLEHLLEVEGVLQDELRASGHTLYLQTAARVRHLNISRWSSFTTENFHSGRLYGATRAQNWTTARRALYVAGSPLIPVLRLQKALSHLNACRSLSRRQKRALSRRALFALLAGAMLHTAGEVVGYGFGKGDAAQRKSCMESHRYRHLCGRERVLESPQ